MEVKISCVDNENEKCNECEDAYYTSNYQCLKNTEVEHCTKYASDEDNCTSCENGYYLNNSQCIKSTEVDHCTTYDSDEDKCNSCEDNYMLEDENVCTECPLGCKYCATALSITVCLCLDGEYFTLENGVCYPEGSFKTFDEEVYGCFIYNEDESIEVYEPVDGKCGKSSSNGTIRKMLISAVLMIIFLI
ncbi:hypothetical protein QTN25_004035 [Entamoeba marina]